MSCPTSEKAPCCCGGCCPDELIPADLAATPPVAGSVLKVEIIESTVPCCLTVGTTLMLTDSAGGGLWTSNGECLQHCDNGDFMGLAVGCGGDRLVLSWDYPGACGGCPVTSTTPLPLGLWEWTPESSRCDPLSAVFRYDFADDPITGCECATSGYVRVKVTIVPPN